MSPRPPPPRAVRLGFALMVAGLAWLMLRHEILARSWVWIAVQGLAILLMVAARLTFGRRSFHAAANPTAGGSSDGPYRWLAPSDLCGHPVFHLGTADDHPRSRSGRGVLGDAGAAVRMYAERLCYRYPIMLHTARARRA